MRPIRQTTHAAGADLTAQNTVIIPEGGSAIISTGYVYDIVDPSLLKGRSGLAFKYGIIAYEGLIDSDYREEVKVKLFNLGDGDYIIRKGDRVAQLVPFYSYAHSFYGTTGDIRNGGFGSTDESIDAGVE